MSLDFIECKKLVIKNFVNSKRGKKHVNEISDVKSVRNMNTNIA